jgi:hypothetical protein
MKKVIIFSLLVGLFLSFQKATPRQFFVEGYLGGSSKYIVTLDGENKEFTTRYDLIKFMNSKGFKCTTHSFYCQNEFFIFE